MAWDNSLMQTPSSKSSFNSTYQCQQIRPGAAICHINNDNACFVIIKEFIKTLLLWNIKNKNQCGSGTYREYGICADVRHLYVCEEWQIKISLDKSLLIIFLSLDSFFSKYGYIKINRLLFKAQNITFLRCISAVKDPFISVIGYHSTYLIFPTNSLIFSDFEDCRV